MYKHPNKGTQILPFVPFPTQRTAPISRYKRLIFNTALRIQLSEMVTQALRLIASILLIQRREKCPSCEEKSTFT